MISSFKPIFGGDCKILILGSCPSVQSLQKNEYYGNKQNRFWRVVFEALGEDYTDDYATKTQTLLKHGIGLWDVIGRCKRVGSLDSAITDVFVNDIKSLVQDTKVKCILLNGGKARSCFKQKIEGVEVISLPSTSPANARMTFEQLLTVWKEALAKYL